MEHKTVKRVMLGDVSSAEMIITKNEIIDDMETEGVHKYKGDCEIKFYFGTRPVILHNDTTTDDVKESLDAYASKLLLILDMALEVNREMGNHPDKAFLVRNFLNEYSLEDRLFGGTLLILYSPRYKMVTFDISDCSNKLRKTFSPDNFNIFIKHLSEAIRESLYDIGLLREKLGK